MVLQVRKRDWQDAFEAIKDSRLEEMHLQLVIKQVLTKLEPVFQVRAGCSVDSADSLVGDNAEAAFIQADCHDEARKDNPRSKNGGSVSSSWAEDADIGFAEIETRNEKADGRAFQTLR